MFVRFVHSALYYYFFLLLLQFHRLPRRVAFPWMVFPVVRCIFSSFSFRLFLLLFSFLFFFFFFCSFRSLLPLHCSRSCVDVLSTVGTIYIRRVREFMCAPFKSSIRSRHRIYRIYRLGMAVLGTLNSHWKIDIYFHVYCVRCVCSA